MCIRKCEYQLPTYIKLPNLRKSHGGSTPRTFKLAFQNWPTVEIELMGDSVLIDEYIFAIKKTPELVTQASCLTAWPVLLHALGLYFFLWSTSLLEASQDLPSIIIHLPE